MTGIERRSKPRRHRNHARHRADHQIAARLAGAALQFLLQQLAFLQHAPRGGEHFFTLVGEADKSAAALDDGDSKLFLQRAHRVRQRRLRDVRRLGRTAKMAMPLKLNQVAQGDEEIHGWQRVKCS